MIQRIRNKTVESFLMELTADSTSDYSLWRVTKILRRPTSQRLPLRKRDGIWARNDQQKANAFAEHLKNVFQPNDWQEEANVETLVRRNKGNSEERLIDLVSPKEVQNEIKYNINKYNIQNII